MNKALLVLGGLGLGAGLIYMSASDREEQYRRLAPAQWQTYRRRTNDLIGQTSRSLARQTRGLLGKARPPLKYGWRQRQMLPTQAGMTGGTQSLLILGCVGIGAGLMYMLDPKAGQRRRALVYDKAQSYWHATCDFLAKTGRDASNRTRGLVHETRTQLGRTGERADAVLAEESTNKARTRAFAE
jgi:uncharacterized protein HemX